MRSKSRAVASVRFSNTSHGPEGWKFVCFWRVAKKNWGSEFEFDQYIIDLRRFQPLGKYNNFNIRRAGRFLTGDRIMQKMFDLGGLGTIECFSFQV